MLSKRLGMNLRWVILPAGLAIALLVIVAFSSVGKSDPVLPPAKQAIVEQELRERNDAASIPTAPYRGPPPSSALSPGVDAGVPAGLGKIYEGPGPFSSEAYLFNTSWRTAVGPNTLIIYAGSDGQDKEQGVLLALLQRPDNSYMPDETRRYFTPRRVGPVRIVGAKNMTITLEADDGTTFEFDASSRELLLVSTPPTISPR